MIDSYASSKIRVHEGTQEKYSHPESRAKQHVDVPTRWLDVGPKSGTYRKVIRKVTVLGTIEISTYGTRRVEYGKCNLNGHVVLVVLDGSFWTAIDRKPINGCIA